MNTQTVLLIILAAIVALGLVFFQYHFKSKKRGRLGIVLSILRFITWFAAFLLLINPKFSKHGFTVEKTNLLLLSDNSSSVADYSSDIDNTVNELKSSEDVQAKFKLNSYNFGTDLVALDSLDFSSKTTNIEKAIKSLKDIYPENSAIVLLSDGNQTFGNDYVYGSSDSQVPIYPVAIGDTTRYEDIKINQVNANKYAFLKNKYPVEIFVSYEGLSSVSKIITVSLNGKTVFTENIKMSEENSSKVINTLLDAGSVGIKYLEVSVSTLENERNTNNNKKALTVEVIDEKTDVAIVSDMLHPDIGALKKSIEKNEQRTVSLIKPNDKNLDDVDLFILYQPNSAFKSIYEYIRRKNANSFSVIGPKADLRFINGIQKKYRVEDNYPLQEVVPMKNDGFSKFDISRYSFENYPPLDSDVGPIGINGEHETLLQMKIKGVTLASPLLTILTEDENKSVLLFGENIWKWRIQAFRDNQNFQEFDEFVGKLMVYLSENQSRERLTLDFKSVYEGSSEARISASYFDETFTFDSNANLSLLLKNRYSGASSELPLLLKNDFYEVDLSDRPAGEYQFTFSVKNENISKSGFFRILDFDVEKQFVSTNDLKLRQLADRSEGQLFYSNQVGELIEALTADERYLPVQSSTKKVVSLIDFRILLGLIALTLALEWFIRKYNGLI